MELLGETRLADPLLLLPGGFWTAVNVWLEKPQVANKRLCGARLEEVRRVARPRHGTDGKGTGSDARRSVLEAAWEAFCCSEDCKALGLIGPEEEGEMEVVLRTLVPKGSPSTPEKEMVVKDVSNGIVTFLPLEHVHECRYEVKRCNIYQIRLRHIQDNEWSVSILSSSPENCISDGIVYPKTVWLGRELLSKLAKWSTETVKQEFKSTLSLISVARYSKKYQDLKEKYKEIVKVWPEVTDPEKFVYEDVAIAAYLLILWEDERTERSLSKKQCFMDLGCGNGLLVHILSNEGHPGKGIDIRRRKIWDMYGPQTCLEENVVRPNSLYPDVDWLIGNHSDELTPWIPVIAARSSYSCRYFLLPCCFFDFHGKYNRRQSKKTQYREYLDFVTEVGLVCGFNVEEDCLRIPSTKRVCLIGKSRSYLATQDSTVDEQRARYISSRQSCRTVAAADKMDEQYQNDSYSTVSDVSGTKADKEVSQKTDMENVLISGFLPRGKEQVRNCTALPQKFVEKVVLKVAKLLLCEVEENPHGNSSTWRRGVSLSLSDLAEQLDKDTLKTLKNEYGGLQTLLRNNHQVFEGPEITSLEYFISCSFPLRNCSGGSLLRCCLVPDLYICPPNLMLGQAECLLWKCYAQLLGFSVLPLVSKIVTLSIYGTAQAMKKAQVAYLQIYFVEYLCSYTSHQPTPGQVLLYTFLFLVQFL
ncbi:probable tRNA (uracil-O(2)-)-methyltransferase isoform X2 [Varanus komodoensis]|uniref:probable tRNA (uracil-O(2)-)-methyltransferase isoform X2 n=1 Tax=Varanus komodoensis TaxID=61221 RepID=UPI001CF7D75F|nr:probable tRNA (uracil-O(2)-)-methyltransferase isoform X2 [Varanus komodoensis]